MFDDRVRRDGAISKEEYWVSFNALCTVLHLKMVNNLVYLPKNMPMLGSTQADFIDITLDRVQCVMYVCT